MKRHEDGTKMVQTNFLLRGLLEGDYRTESGWELSFSVLANRIRSDTRARFDRNRSSELDEMDPEDWGLDIHPFSWCCLDRKFGSRERRILRKTCLGNRQEIDQLRSRNKLEASRFMTSRPRSWKKTGEL